MIGSTRLRDIPCNQRRELCEQIAGFEESSEWHALASATGIRWETLWNLFSTFATEEQRARRSRSLALRNQRR